MFFKAPPHITSFTFGEESIPEGETASVQCFVQKGDLPLEINWLHNGDPINNENQIGVTFSKLSSRISTLNIESVRAEHRGNYTCMAVNKAGKSEYVSELHVDGTRSFLYRIEFFKVLLIIE